MNFRRHCFSCLGALALLWTAGMALYWFSIEPEQAGVTEDESTWFLSQAMCAIASTCAGLLMVTAFGLLAWRNEVGLRSERRYQEQLRAAQLSQYRRQ